MSLFDLANTETSTIVLLCVVLIVFYLISFLVKEVNFRNFSAFGIVAIGFIIMINIQTLIGLFIIMSGFLIGFGASD